MEANELMLGDIVSLWGKTPVKITSIYDVCAGYVSEDKHGVAGMECFVDMPLSREILEKNGGTCIAVGDHGAATPRKLYSRFEKWTYPSGNGNGIIPVWYDCTLKKWSMAGMSVYFDTIRIFQHLLAVLGIDREISL